MTNSTEPTDFDSWMQPGAKNAQLIYILYFVGFFLAITTIIGVVMAYMNRGKAGDVVDTHYTWLIRTFWIALLGSLIAFVLMFVLIGFILILAVIVWSIVRLIKGLQAIGNNQPIPDPESWWI